MRLRNYIDKQSKESVIGRRHKNKGKNATEGQQKLQEKPKSNINKARERTFVGGTTVIFYWCKMRG